MKLLRIDLKSHWTGSIVLGAALIFFFWAASRGWNSPPTDSHASRQTQTAITAEMLHENGLSPLTPFNGLGAPWTVPMEFPTYQIVTAFLANFTEGDIISAGRVSALLGALLLIPPLWILLRRVGLDFNEQCFAVALLFTTPLWLHFSRSILIETWAIALAVAWLAALVEILYRREIRLTWIGAAALLGVFAALTKVTSFAIVLPLGAIVTLICWRQQGRRAAVHAAAVTAPGIIAAVGWTRYGDTIKEAHPYAEFLTSENLSAWNWGTWNQRLDPIWWERWADHLQLMFPAVTALLLLVGWWRGNRRQRFGIGLALLAVITGPLAFANLYYVHNYYSMAVAPAMAVAVGIAFASLWRWTGSKKLRQGAGVVLLLGLGVWQAHTYLDTLGRGQVRDRPLPAFGEVLNRVTTESDRIVFIGQEWDPILTYTVDRPQAFVRETYETDEDAWQRSRRAMGDKDFTVLVAIDSVAGDTAFVHHRCRELGLATAPLLSTERADVYVSVDRLTDLAPLVAELQQSKLILPTRPDRMGPGESRVEFITADWRPLTFAEANGMFDQCSPYPSEIFTRHAPAQLEADGRPVLHIHPPGGLRFEPRSIDRQVEIEYGLRPEIWLNQHDSDGVRFRIFGRGPDGRLRLLWSDFVQPLSEPDDRRMLRAELSLPADHELELWIDAGPDHNPGYDWSIIGSLRVR